MEEHKKKNVLDNEKELVERAKKDEQAFTVLYNFYFPKIYRYIFARVGDHDIAEDLVSRTFLKVFVNLNGYSYKGYTFGAWVYKIATNILIDYYRKESRKKEVDIDSIGDIPDNNYSPINDIENREKREKIDKILRRLSPRYQKILYLRFFADMSTEEIAVMIGVSVNNARVIKYRALKKFRKKYDEIYKK